jgi:hypothetical protein
LFDSPSGGRQQAFSAGRPEMPAGTVEPHSARPAQAPKRGQPTMSEGELRMLATYLFGPRWQSALARELRINLRLVQRWAAGDRPVSTRLSRQIAELVARRHAQRARQVRERYVAMAESLNPSLQAALLALVPPL